MAKVIIYLRDHEFTALNELAQREYRAPKAQAALMLRRELEKLGMIPGEQQINTTPIKSPSDTQSETVLVEG